MGKRLQQQFKAFFKKWRIWLFQFVVWIILLIRDEYATNVLLYFGKRYGGKMEAIARFIISMIPKDVSGWALLLLIVTVCGVLIYNVWDISRSKKEAQNNKNESIETSSEPGMPLFYSRRCRAELTIRDQNADIVVNFLYQLLYDIPKVYSKNNIQITAQRFTYYNPEKDNVVRHEFVQEGVKQVFPEGFVIPKISELKNVHMGATLYEQAVEKVTYLREMLFISVIQGGTNTTQVKFNTNDKDVFEILPRKILGEFQKTYTITNIKGFPEEEVSNENQEKTKRKPTSRRKKE